MAGSRYRDSAPLTRRDPSGRLVRYLAPRILPLPAGTSTTTVKPGEVHRLDLIAYRALRDPEQAWRIADANAAMDPFALCERAGAELRLP
jgi:hypothetical protein